MKIKALIYCRVSSERQVVDGNGLGSQEQRCRTYAKGKGYDVERVFSDEGVSGSLFERPALRSLLYYLEQHPEETFVVIVDELSRLARGLGVHLRLRAELAARGAQLESPNFNFEDSPEGEFIENILASKAQLDRQQNRRQVIQKTKARLERGYWTFHVPFGLKYIKSSTHGKILVPHEPYASIYKEAIESYRDGVFPTVEEVLQFVNKKYKEHGLDSKMSQSNAKRMLQEVLYAGYLEFKEWEIELRKAQHEGFISIETYRIVQDRLSGVVKPWKRKNYNESFPLRPLVLCATCKTPMTGSQSTGRHGYRYAHYYCRNPKNKCKFGGKTLRKRDFEDSFRDYLLTKKPLDDVLDLTQDVLLEQWEQKEESYSLNLLQSQRALEEVSQEITNYAQLAGRTKDEELITVYEEEIKKLRKKRNDFLGMTQQTKKYTKEQFGTATEKVFGTLKQPLRMWQSDEYDDKRTILLMYFNDQLQYDRNLGFGTASLDYPINVIASIADSKNLNVDD